MNLEKGKLYQVKNGSDWVIAEYGGHTDKHIVHGIRSDGKRTWTEDAMEWWRALPHGNTFRVTSKRLQIRPVTDETLAEIKRLTAEAQRLYNARLAVLRTIRELCQ